MKISRRYNARILVLLLRVLTIGVRFLFNILIIKDLNLEEYGTYAIFYTSISLSVIVVGFDYYYYNTREIIRASQNEQKQLLGDQLILHILMYVVFIPLSFGLLINFIPINYLFVFYLILVFEHLSQEGYRLLIAYSMPIFANFTQFVKMAMWCLVVTLILLVPIESIDISLTTIFTIWLIFVILSTVIIGIYLLKKGLISIEISKKAFQRIKNGIRVSYLFFISTLLFKSIEFSSRYFLDYFTTKSDVAIFTFFSNISNLIYVTVHSTSIIIIYPQLIKAFSDENKEIFRNLKRRFLKEILIISSMVFVFIIFTVPYLLQVIDKEALQENYKILIILLIGMMFFMFSYYPHYMLYLKGKDSYLLVSSVIAAIITLILNFILTQSYGLEGSAYATMLGFCSLFTVKYLFYRKNETQNPGGIPKDRKQI